jgi:hypothetical protein
VARNPERLRKLLIERDGVQASLIDRYLTIHQGDAKDAAAVAKVIADPTNKEALVDVIISGLGVYPTFQWSIKQPFPLTDPTICETTTRTLFKVLSDIYAADESLSKSAKPLLVVVSTAGSGRRRSIPFPLQFPYRYFLSSPLADKIRMEQLIFENKNKDARDYVIARPMILSDGEESEGGIRPVSWEWGTEERKEGEEPEPSPKTSFFVSKKDVGRWIFEDVVVKGGSDGKCVYF